MKLVVLLLSVGYFALEFVLEVANSVFIFTMDLVCLVQLEL